MGDTRDGQLRVLPLYFFPKYLATFFSRQLCGVTPGFFFSKTVTITRFLLLSLGCHPPGGCHPTPFYLSDLVSPLFFVNLPTNNFFLLGVTPLEVVTWGGPLPLPLVTPLSLGIPILVLCITLGSAIPVCGLKIFSQATLLYKQFLNLNSVKLLCLHIQTVTSVTWSKSKAWDSGQTWWSIQFVYMSTVNSADSTDRLISTRVMCICVAWSNAVYLLPNRAKFWTCPFHFTVIIVMWSLQRWRQPKATYLLYTRTKVTSQIRHVSRR